MLEQLIKDPAATVVDVRTREEFSGGNVADSINIPLQELGENIEKFKSMQGPIILCCASGGRSGMATQILSSQGFKNVYNGGSWLNVNYAKNN